LKQFLVFPTELQNFKNKENRNQKNKKKEKPFRTKKIKKITITTKEWTMILKQLYDTLL